MSSPGLGEPIVHEYARSATDPVQDAIEHPQAGFILVEAQPHVIVHCATWLRRAKRVNELHVTRQWVGIALVVARTAVQERRYVAQRGEANTRHERIGGGVRKFVQVTRLKRGASRSEADGFQARVGVVPAVSWHHRRRVFVAHPSGQRGLGFSIAGRGIRQWQSGERGVVDDQFLERRTRK
jgi:hypothetical protein